MPDKSMVIKTDIYQCEHIKEVIANIKRLIADKSRTIILFDLDLTIFDKRPLFMSDLYKAERSESLRAIKQVSQELVDLAYASSEYHLVEPSIAEEIRQLVSGGHTVLGFTLRRTGKPLASYMAPVEINACETLSKLGVVFSRVPNQEFLMPDDPTLLDNPSLPPYEVPGNPKIIEQLSGSGSTIFCNNYNKAHVLRCVLDYLNTMGHDINHVVVVDDNIGHIKKIQQSCEVLGIQLTGIHYTFAESNKPPLDLEIVKIQTDTLITHRRLLSDTEAEIIAKKAPVIALSSVPGILVTSADGSVFCLEDVLPRCRVFLDDRAFGIDYLIEKHQSVYTAYSRYYNNNHYGLARSEIQFLSALSENTARITSTVVDTNTLLTIARTLALGSNWVDMHVKDTVNPPIDPDLKSKLAVNYSVAAVTILEKLSPHYINAFKDKNFSDYTPDTLHIFVEGTMYAAHKACKARLLGSDKATYQHYLPVFNALLNAAEFLNDLKLQLTIMTMLYFPVKTVSDTSELRQLLTKHIEIAVQIEDHFEIAQTSYRLAMLESECEQLDIAKSIIERALVEVKLSTNSKCPMLTTNCLILLKDIEKRLSSDSDTKPCCSL